MKHWISFLKAPSNINSLSLNKLAQSLAIFFVGAYRTLGTNWIGGACRFEPSCSDYCQEAFKKHPFRQALRLTFKRVSNCRPGGGFGFDPVPEVNKDSI